MEKTRTNPPEIVAEDNHVLDAVKPPNLPMQADASGDPDMLTLLKAFIKERDGKPGNVFLGLVHRLDRPATGLVVFAKTSKAAARLAAAMQAGKFDKEYLAIVRGCPAPDPKDAAGDGWIRWRDWLVKDRETNTVRAVSAGTPDAKEARLAWTALATRDGLTLVRIRLDTGRSHQIRVQFASRGCPLWGDMRYDEGHNRPGMQLALCAYRLAFPHPVRDGIMEFALPLPGLEPWPRFAEIDPA